jgi:hypothetical protein
MCDACLVQTIDGPLCVACTAKRSARRSRRVIGVVSASVVVIVVALGAMFTLGARDKLRRAMNRAANPAKPPPDEPLEVRLLREKLAKYPCDMKTALELATELLRQDLEEKVLAFVPEYEAACGGARTPLELRWRLFTAQKQLERWDTAHETVTKLIEDDPRDSDYWWWRGEVKEKLGQDRAAIADYRQSVANSDDYQAASFAVGHVSDPAKRADRRCETGWVLRYYRDQLGGWLRDSDEDELLAIELEGVCARRASGARAFIPIATGGKPSQVKATIGTAKGTFLVDERSGTTVITRAFAVAAGLVTGDDVPAGRVETGTAIAAGMVLAGLIATVDRLDLDGVAAHAVDVLIVEQLPGGFDGSIGLDVLWRFDTTVEETRIAIHPRADS